jgi:hypothetical protein
MCRNKVEGSSGHDVPKRELEVDTMCRNEEEEEEEYGHPELARCTKTMSSRYSLRCSEAREANVPTM